MDTARVGGVDDVGDHIEDGDCVPTCVFTALDMDIAKVGGVEVVVVKMKNCHFETSLVTKNYWLQSDPPHPLFQITPVLNTGLSLSEPQQLYKGYNAI